MMDESQVLRCIEDYLRGAGNPDMLEYGSKILDSLQGGLENNRFLWSTKHLMKLSGSYEKRILDVGCGFGWDTIAVALLGQNQVTANDVRKEMTEPLAKGVAVLQEKGIDIAVQTVTGDICSLEFSPESFDVIWCLQTIEHVHDLDTMFKVWFSLLQKQGRCVITNVNNALNKNTVSETREMWRERDTSWDYIEQLKKSRPIENKDIEPYAEMRKKIIREAEATLSVEKIATIAEATAGMTADEIKCVSMSYKGDLTLPSPPPLSWCRNPMTGEYCERLLNPYEIAGMLEAQGFRASVRHGFRRFPLSLLNGTGIKLLSQLLFNLRPYFIIVGTKE